jgi:DDE superfamily endonuclease
MDIIALLQCLQPVLTATTIRRFSRIVFALFAMTGRVTMLGVSRWAGTGGSYRTIQRWFYTTIPWAQVLVRFFRQHWFQANATYLLAGDEVVVTKAGKHTLRLRSGQALWTGSLFLWLVAKGRAGLGFLCFGPGQHVGSHEQSDCGGAGLGR